jgi:iduronate 2-sulfatase
MVHNNSVGFRAHLPNVVTLPGFFKQSGYKSIGMGKVFHLLNQPGDHDDEFSWSEPMLRVGAEDFYEETGKHLVRAVTDDERKGQPLLDEFVTMKAKEALKDLSEKALSGEQPFFLAVGMKKPHLPFVYPERFKTLYPKKDINMPSNPHVPQDLPPISWFNSNEVSGRVEYKAFTGDWSYNHTFPNFLIKELRQGYYSSISYIDSLIGEILTQLDELGLSNNTVVTFIGDHGYHLGEHSIFGKNTNFNVANNSPMMVHVPGVAGRVSDKLVEFVDLFPTLVELAGFSPLPNCPRDNRGNNIELCTEGSSLAPLIWETEKTVWKDRVFFQYPRYLGRGQEYCMGYSMKTDKHRYTEWVEYAYNSSGEPNWKNICAVELYNHVDDPNETVNLAENVDWEETRKELSEQLRDGWFAALPS